MKTSILLALLSILAATNPAATSGSLATDDLLDIIVWGVAQPDEPTIFHERVDPTGQINLPMIGIVSVKGLSPQQASAKIDGAFRAKQVIKEPHAQVKVVESGPSVS